MFSENLKSLRKAHKLTQKQLADEIGVSARTIQNYERGTILPKKRVTIQKLAAFFDVPVTALITPADFYAIDAAERSGPKDAVKVRLLLSDMTALFSGGNVTEEDKDLVMRTLNELYWESKRMEAQREVIEGHKNPITSFAPEEDHELY